MKYKYHNRGNSAFIKCQIKKMCVFLNSFGSVMLANKMKSILAYN